MTHKFDPTCPDCKPVILDAKTMEPLPADSPAMKAVLKIWDDASREEQEAFNRVAVHNSRRVPDLLLTRKLSERMSKALTAN